MHRLQAQTLPDAAPPIGKIHPFSKNAVTLEPVWRGGADKIFSQRMNQLFNQSINDGVVWRGSYP